jgi:hypothetical protein
VNPITRLPWALSESARNEITGILRRDRFARTMNVGFLVAQIDAAAGEYRCRRGLWDEITDGHGPSYERVRRLAQRGSTFARGALQLESDWQFRRGRGRPPATREKAALVFALARCWPNGLTISPKSSFVRTVGTVLADCGTPTRNPYKLVERINKSGIPPISRLEPMMIEGFRP